MPLFVKSGSELQVNSAGAYTQSFSRIARFADGGYIIVWNTTDPAQDGDGGAVKAQRFDANGVKVGGEFLVNSSFTASQTTPVVTTFADGSFAIAWATSDTLQDGSAGAIKARLFSASGTPLGAEFLVNTTVAGNQNAPNIVTLANGNFLVSWDDAGTTDVHGRIFTASGVPLGGDFRINTNLTGSQNFNDIVALGGGGFVAVWRTTDGLQDGSSDSVKGQLFDQNGAKVGGEFLINTNTSGAQTDPSVTSLTNGGFVVTWVTSWNSEDGSSSGIKAQIFDSSGAKVGGEFLVNSAALSAQMEPVVTGLPNGEFMIAWMTLDSAQDGNGNAVKAQVFDSNGARFGAEFLVNTQATGNQSVADIVTLADGSVVINWTDTYADGPANWGIRAQHFTPAAPPPPVNQAPVITSDGQGANAVLSHNENVALVTTVTALDPEGQAVTYSIVGGADAARFTLGSVSGILSFVAAPNHEAPTDSNGDNVYEVIVQASDGSLFDLQTLYVTVANVNEPITFTTSNNVLMPETWAGPYTVNAFEPDNVSATITYSIAGGADAALFAIDSATGQVTFLTAPDFEAPADSGGNNVYDLVIGASDGISSATQAIRFTVYDLDEAPVIGSNGGGSSASLSISENQSAVTIVSAADPDGQAVTYAISGGADAARFTINSATGALAFVAAPNFEAPNDSGANNVYNVTVSASAGGKTDTQALSITVLNANEALAITSNGGGASASVSVGENGVSVTIVAATDVDGTAPTYSIAGGADAALFVIDPATGALRFASAPNFEAPGDAGGDNVYDLVVAASDGSLTDTQAVAVTATNANEGVTIISGAAASVSENGLAAGNVSAVDADGDAVTYSIAGGPDSALFTIDAATGALSFASAPDFEAPGDADGDNIYDILVAASDGSFTDTKAVSISVTNANEAILFTSASNVSRPENASASHQVAAFDPDDSGASISYSIAGGADASRFWIDPATGLLTLVGIADHELPGDADDDNVYELVVQASSGADSSTQAVHFAISDVNEAPRIVSNGGGTSTSIAIDEGQTAITIVAAVDGEGSAVTYSITGGSDADRFVIDPVTGALSLASAPDYEAPIDAYEDNYYGVIVSASDGVLSSWQSVQVLINNVNEGVSIISGSAFSIVENGTAVTVVVAADVDGTAPVYSIAGGADAALFAIDSATGALRFLAAPNYEAPGDAGGDNVYDVLVAASDGEFGDTRAVSVTVTNANDVAPVISLYGDSVTWNIPENLIHLLAIGASDAEADQITYSLTGPDSALFSIDALTGALSWANPQDYETWVDTGSQPYHVNVVASDGQLSDSLAVTINLTNVNEDVVIVSNGGGSSASVTVDEGVVAVTNVLAVDNDRSAPTYSIVGGADSALFSIDPATGALRFISAPNFEAPGDAGGDNVYDLVVLADDGSLFDTQAIAVTVGDMNDRPQIAVAGLAASENGLAAGSVLATDEDGDVLTYSIAGGDDAGLFAIDSATGALSFLAAPDFEAPGDWDGDNVYEILVSVGDGHLADLQEIIVTVGNENEPLSITSFGGVYLANVSVAENQLAAATVSASDPDGGAVTYSIVGGADSAKFTINSATGQISFLVAPNYEAPGSASGGNLYRLVVAASDGLFSRVQELNVAVTNVNEGVTIVSNGGGASASVSVAENGVNVATVAALDADGGAVTYSIAGGADAARFTINAATGALRFIAAPNHEAPADAGSDNVYDVIVKASDGTFSDTQSLAVTVTNVMEGNTITGTSANNTISTSTSVSGQPKATELEDVIYGMGGADTISGAGGGDVIDGGTGNDSITGGLGADRLTGGAGADTFVYTNVSDSTASVRDLILDFNRAEGDRISLTSIDANVNAGGNQNFTFIGSNAFSGVAGQLRWEIIDGHTIISADTNGDRVADLQIELNASLPLVSTDFLL